ncbi:MAG: hypothetical protein ACYC4F_01960 [Armatimonadota bacterium]
MKCFRAIAKDCEPLPHPLPLLSPAEGERPVPERCRPRNVLGSLPMVTGIFGLTAANPAITLLSDSLDIDALGRYTDMGADGAL